MIDTAMLKLQLVPEGQEILAVVKVRDGAVIVTDMFVYHATPDPDCDFTLRRIAPVPWP